MRIILAALSCATAATFACGGDDEQPSSTSSAPGAGFITATASSASPSDDPADAAIASAIALVDGVPEADCTTNNPELRDCVSLDPDDREVASRGIAILSVEGSAGGSFALLMGRVAEGNWDYYAGGQQYYQPTKLPGEIRVCTQGTGLNIRAEPSSDANLISTVEDNTTVTGEEFVLTQPGAPPPVSEVAGYGWYRISAPAEGWVYSKYVSGLADCSLHDSLESP